MKKYIFIIMLSIISLASVKLGYAKTAADACKGNNIKNGDSCTYQQISGGRGQSSTTKNIDGFCDRTNGDPDASKNPLICKPKDPNSTDNWEVCTVTGDACKSGDKLGVCGTRGARGIPCDTTRSTSTAQDGSNSSVTTSCVTNAEKDNKCGTNPKCSTGQVCANVDGTTKCVTNTEKDNKCGTNPKCPTGQVCVSQSSPSNGANSGGTSGATDASSPQTVGFINPSRFNSITELIAGVINALLGILGAITVAVLVASGFKYMIGSNPGEVGQALEGIRNAIVGLMIIMGAFLITQYVITALAS